LLVRFVILSKDADSGNAAGVLVSAHTLRDEGKLTQAEHTELREALRWFNLNLTIPKLLEDTQHRRAISWFKPTASEAISRMWQLKRILESHGCFVNVLRTTNPGVVVYEDEWQIVAKPPRGARFPSG
jgi:hypothetical protein